MRKQILARVAEVMPNVISTRRDLHQHPELGLTEFRTSSLVARRLRQLGFAVKIGREVMEPSAMMGLPSAEELEAAYRRAEQEGADPEILPRTPGGFTGVVGELCTGRPGPSVAMRLDMDCIPALTAYRLCAMNWAEDRGVEGPRGSLGIHHVTTGDLRQVGRRTPVSVCSLSLTGPSSRRRRCWR